MAELTPKQQRNGIPPMESGAGENVAKPSDPVDIPVGPAVAAGMAFQETGLPLMLGDNPGSAVQVDWSEKIAYSDVGAPTVSGGPASTTGVGVGLGNSAPSSVSGGDT